MAVVPLWQETSWTDPTPSPTSSPSPADSSEQPSEEPSEEPTEEPVEEETEEPVVEETETPDPDSYRYSFTHAGASAYACSVEGRLHSVNGWPSQLMVINESPYSIQIHWLDSAGNRQQYTTLEPGHNYRIDSFGNHAWLIADHGANCIQIFGLAANGSTITVS
ncbi:hypothetical protein [Nonomuraea sp. C10]|uniref:VHL beta domain-containing protein n=1 Tax=Nonomuraea sp. C10 TaxID=2600577 RepID=UPI00164F09C5|nr:hypothetical protein [Nonomuraea sp. C10]